MLEKIRMILVVFITDIDKSVYFEFYIDQLSYQEKTVLLKENLEEYISTGKIVDDKNKAILAVLKKHLIYKHKEQYYIFEEDYDIVGFFVCNTDKFYQRKRKR